LFRVRESEVELMVLHPSFSGIKPGMFNVRINTAFLGDIDHA
jgi:hypothetical protein